MNILELTLFNALERMLAGEFGAVEYVRAMLEHNKEVAQLNAVICLDEERLLEAAARRDRQRQAGGSPALLGAPLLLKDNINSADLPTTGCTPALNGQQLPTMPTIIRNTDPSSNVGIPSLSVAVGLAADGLPVGVCLEGSAGSDRKILAIGKALQDEVGFLPRPGIRAKGDGIEFRPHSTKQ